MTAKDLRNVSASVLARLLARAKGSGEDYSALLNAFLCERFLHRLDQSRARGRFVLKGAMLLRLWSDQPYRATRDIDFLRKGDGSAAAIRADIAAVCRTVVVDDGVAFDAASIRVRAIRAEDEYAGLRVTLAARIGSARMPFQMDVGVGDAAWPPPKVQPYPALLEFPAPKILAYPPEAVIAEKLEAIVVLGDRNSRIKDFFDIRHLAERFPFDRRRLAEAIRKTFERRATPIPLEPFGLTRAYWENPSRAPQVRAFARRAHIAVGPDPGHELLAVLRPFLLPLLADLQQGITATGTWPAGGPWQ